MDFGKDGVGGCLDQWNFGPIPFGGGGERERERNRTRNLI